MVRASIRRSSRSRVIAPASPRLTSKPSYSYRMSGFSSIRTFGDFRDAVFAFRLSRILLTALDLNLFTEMGTRSWRIPTLAKRLGISTRGLDILCRNLASVGLLDKRGELYKAGRLGQRMLNANSPDYRGGYLDLMRRQWEDWAHLTESVRTGRPVDGPEPDEKAYRRSFSWAMHHRSLDIARKVASQLNFRGAESLLDVGGGPGTYALAFLAKNPQLHATVCDRPPALQVAQEIAASVKHGKRLSYLPLDFMEQPIPGTYDVIWVANVIHIYSPEENRTLFRKLARALAPGGRLLVQDAFLLDREGLKPYETTIFATTMLLFTERGNTYRLQDTQQWLRTVGFKRVRSMTLAHGGDWDGVIVEASRPSPPRGIRGRRARLTRS